MKSNIYKIGLLSLLLLLPAILSLSTYNLPEQGRLAGNFYVHNHKFDYPTAEQSCIGIASSESYGFFWDGQKCEKCAQLECLCDANNPCRKCIDGWILINKQCVQCLQFDQNFEYFNKIDDIPQEADIFARRNDDISLVLHKGRSDVMVQCCNPFTNLNIIDWQSSWQSGLRATQCIQPQVPGFDPVYVLAGSFCWYMQGCQEYKPNGKCLTCQDGYFIDDNQICRECMYQAKAESTVFTDVFPGKGNGNLGLYQQKICQKCKANNQCDKCRDGFYLYTTSQFYVDQNTSSDGSFFKSKREDVLKSASWCTKCISNCACSVDQNNKETNLKPIDNSWYKKGNTCFTCDSNNNNKFCNTCSYNEVLDKFQCLSCKTYAPGTTKFKYSAITYMPSSNGDCVQCKEGCYYCRFSDITTSSDTTCEIGGINYCKNGYYAQKTAAGIVVCVKCTDTQTNQNNNRLYARCKTNTVSDSNVIVTQCITDSGVDDSTKYEDKENIVGYHNMQPPSVKDYYLVSTIDKKMCVLNINNCKNMIDQNAKCSSCYENLGWVNVQNICKQCLIENCDKCKVNSAGNGLSCDVCSITSPKYTVKTDDELRCLQCPLNCATCKLNGVLAETLCLTCKDGYFFNATSTPAACLPCSVKNCRDCKANVTICNSCVDYYRLWKGSNLEQRSNQLCEACEIGCKTCETRKVCTLCADSVLGTQLYLWEGQCHRYKTNCLLMSTQGKCDICKTGFRLVDQRCLRCLDLTGGFVHCALGCDTSGLRWYTTIDADYWITK